MKREKVIFLSAKNPFAVGDWSGIPFFLFRSLSTVYDVEYVALPAFPVVRRIGYYFSIFFQKLTGRKYVFDYGLVIACLYGIVGSFRLWKKENVHFVFSPAGLTELAFLRTSIPIVAYGDCSTLQLINYYPALVNVASFSAKEIEIVERNAFKRITYSIFSSDWATFFVLHRYAKQSITIPFGSNILEHGRATSSKEGLQKKCNLLFVGVDWKRKGGDVVLKIHQALLDIGIPSQLTLVGLTLPDGVTTPESVTIISNINKDSKEGDILIRKLFEEASFFILPTRADCSPIVISEAFSFGLPVLATNTGGISSQIEHGTTGFLFPEDDVEEYVRTITKLFGDDQLYMELSKNCLEAYRKVFNWNSWIISLQKLISVQNIKKNETNSFLYFN